jgi:peptidoglycan-N-acetylglucosamine deacetylase
MLPLLIGAAAAASVGLSAFHAMSPRSQLYGRTFIGTPGVGKQLALTFDDGPNDPHTLHLLDVLAKHDVKATFFVIGKYVRQRPEIARRLIAAGHEIGNHTFSHPNLAITSANQTRHELRDCESALADAGVPLTVVNGSKLFRPPFGGRRPVTFRIARELGYEPIMWSVWCFDWRQTTTNKVVHHAVTRISGGDVIVLHDGGHHQMGADRAHTVEATDRIVTRYKADGMTFVSIGQILNIPTLRDSAPPR